MAIIRVPNHPLLWSKENKALLPEMYGPMTREEYDAYRLTPHWQSLSQKTRKAADYRCQFEGCGLEEWLAKNVWGFGHDVHHKDGTYDRLGCERPDDVMLVCKRHHEIRHWGRSMLKEIRMRACQQCGESHPYTYSAKCKWCLGYEVGERSSIDELRKEAVAAIRENSKEGTFDHHVALAQQLRDRCTYDPPLPQLEQRISKLVWLLKECNDAATTASMIGQGPMPDVCNHRSPEIASVVQLQEKLREVTSERDKYLHTIYKWHKQGEYLLTMYETARDMATQAINQLPEEARRAMFAPKSKAFSGNHNSGSSNLSYLMMLGSATPSEPPA